MDLHESFAYEKSALPGTVSAYSSRYYRLILMNHVISATSHNTVPGISQSQEQQEQQEQHHYHSYR